MKRFLSILLIIVLLGVSCAHTKFINGIEYKSYGLLSKDRKSDDITYKKKPGSIILSIVLIETIVFPVILLGYKLYEPETEFTKGE